MWEPLHFLQEKIIHLFAYPQHICICRYLWCMLAGVSHFCLSGNAWYGVCPIWGFRAPNELSYFWNRSEECSLKYLVIPDFLGRCYESTSALSLKDNVVLIVLHWQVDDIHQYPNFCQQCYRPFPKSKGRVAIARIRCGVWTLGTVLATSWWLCKVHVGQVLFSWNESYFCKWFYFVVQTSSCIVITVIHVFNTVVVTQTQVLVASTHPDVFQYQYTYHWDTRPWSFRYLN